MFTAMKLVVLRWPGAAFGLWTFAAVAVGYMVGSPIVINQPMLQVPPSYSSLRALENGVLEYDGVPVLIEPLPQMPAVEPTGPVAFPILVESSDLKEI